MAQDVASAFDAPYDQERDAFVTRTQDGENEVWPGQDITVLGGAALKVYPIGAGAWIWDEIATSNAVFGTSASTALSE